jgi:hypothetical protein
MANLDQIINRIQLYQDIELASAIAELKKDPTQLQAFLKDQQNNLYTNVTKQKDDTFEKVYGDLDRASKVQESILMHNKRSGELANLQQQIYDQQENSAKSVIDDKNMAGRKNEMNEWSIGNKYDTLFVLSACFIMLSGLILITVLWRLGMISSYLWVALATPLLLIFTLIIIRRSRYTDISRNKRYWNKQIFEGEYGKIPIPLCPGTIQAIEGSIQSVEQNVQQAARGATQGVATAAQSIASTAQSVASTANQMQ